jgi:hypothetical protein
VRAVALVALVACGRIGFDGRTSPAGRDGGGDAIVLTGDASVLGCQFVVCSPGADACCTNGSTSCVATGACGGAVYQCGSCPKFSVCCSLGPDAGSTCTAGDICPAP